MKKEKILPFRTLMDYADGKLNPAEAKTVESLLRNDPESKELVEGIQAIYADEGLDSESLEFNFSKIENRMEKKIQFHSNLSDYLVELNLQLRAAAAVLILVFSFSFLAPDNHNLDYQAAATSQYGPYDLAHGSKIAP